MYDLSDLTQEELEMIAEVGGDRLAAIKARADQGLKRGDLTWSDRLQAEVDAICVDLGIKG